MTELAVVDDHTFTIKTSEKVSKSPAPVGAGSLGGAGALGVAIALDRLFHGADRGLAAHPTGTAETAEAATMTGTELPSSTTTPSPSRPARRSRERPARPSVAVPVPRHGPRAGADRGLSPPWPHFMDHDELAVVDDHTFTIKTSEKVSGQPARRCGGPRQCRLHWVSP